MQYETLLVRIRDVEDMHEKERLNWSQERQKLVDKLVEKNTPVSYPFLSKAVAPQAQVRLNIPAAAVASRPPEPQRKS